MMAQTIVGMTRNFGFDVIAAGVEEHEQLSLLISFGCHSFQGYHFSRPVALAEFEALIDNRIAY